jgi:hypothetical protein
MRLTGKLSQEDLNDVRRIVRSKWYWPRLIMANWYGAGIVCILLWVTVDGLIHGTKVNWKGIGIVWAILAAIVGWAYYTTRRSTATEFNALSTSLPDWITPANDGLRFDGPNGANAFQPWSGYTRWREGKRVIVLYRTQGNGFTMLPIADLSDADLHGLRTMLQTSLPSAQT